MENPQLIEYIKRQQLQGVGNEQIKNSLLSNGWQASDIEENFSIISSPNLPEQNPQIPIKPPTTKWKIIIAILTGLVLIGGGAYVAANTLLKTKETPKMSGLESSPLVTGKPNETIPSSTESSNQNQSQNPEIIFADNLNSCTVYKTSFKHPLTGETLKKEIMGIIGGKCVYREQMPNGGEMECNYAESERVAVAKYYKNLAAAESASTSLETNLTSGEQKVAYTINGKDVENPLQEAINSKICVISGY